jgi:hypothetical protein
MATREEEIKRLAGDKGFASLTAGQKESLPQEGTITSADLTPSAPIVVEEPPMPEDTSATAANALTIPKEEPKPEKTQAQSNLEKLLAEEKAPESQEAAFVAATTTPEILAKEERTKASRGRLLALQAEQQALANIQADIPEQLQEEARGRGITAGGLAPIERGRTREVRRQQLDITNRILAESAIFSAESGDLNSALSKIDKIFELRTADAKAQADFKDKQIDRAMVFANAEQQKQLEKLKAENNRKAEEVANEFDISKSFAEAYLDAGDARTAGLLMNAKTPEERDRIMSNNPLPEKAEKVTPFTLSPGQVRFDEQGNIIAGVAKEEKVKEQTATQLQASGFAKRLVQANTVFDELDIVQGFDPTSPSAGFQRASVFGFNVVPERFKSQEFKQQEQAERNFVNALLRRESGAAISPEEFESAELQYFPRAGDGADVIAQKRANRMLSQQSMLREAGATQTNVDLSDLDFTE